MSLKRTGNYTKALLYGGLAVVLLGTEGVIFVHLIIAGTWRNVDLGEVLLFGLASLIWFLMLNGPFVMLSLTLYWRERMLRLGAKQADDIMPLVPTQPDTTLALHDGERITLIKQRTVTSAIRDALLLSILFIAFASLGELFTSILLPTLGYSNLDPLYTFHILIAIPPLLTSLSFLDWITVAFPITTSAILILLIIFDTILNSRQRIIFDDIGITLKMPLQRHVIPWNDIHVFIQSVVSKSNNIPDVYLVWGRNHGVMLKIDSPQSLLPINGQRGNLRTMYKYTGGFEQYSANTQRLLATIVARGHTPLRTSVQARPGVTVESAASNT